MPAAFPYTDATSTGRHDGLLPKERKEKTGGCSQSQWTALQARPDANNTRERGLWSRFSAFIVWPNIPKAEITELEGLFRESYCKDIRANALNRQRNYRRLQHRRTLE
jgi:hypothetical protein